MKNSKKKAAAAVTSAPAVDANLVKLKEIKVLVETAKKAAREGKKEIKTLKKEIKRAKKTEIYKSKKLKKNKKTKEPVAETAEL